MEMRAEADVEEARERLREWAYYFKDKRHRIRAGSAEGAWRSPQIWDPPEARPVRYLVRALHTWSILLAIPRLQYRALTFWYAHPEQQLFVVLRTLSRYAGHRVTKKEFTELVQIGEFRVQFLLYNPENIGYKQGQFGLASGLGRDYIPQIGKGAFAL